MALIDDVVITVKAGSGGNGGTAKKQMFGSKKTMPDGGNGGNGGNIYLQGNSNISDLSEFRFKKDIRAENGVNGLNKDLDGANAQHTYIKVPFGTTIIDLDTNETAEILTEDPFCVAYGGRGGIGNHDYTPPLLSKSRYKTKTDGISPRNRTGEPGEERRLHLILNLIADVGLVGLPNAGKSSLLKALTNAVPKVGSYPFTTLEPNLGALDKIIMADIPGLIEGASSGKGLGIQFLKHIKKTKILLHCVAADDVDVIKTYETVRSEFKEFDESLLEKEEIIVLTKIDLADEKIVTTNRKAFKKIGKETISVSIYQPETINKLKEKLVSFFASS